MASARGRERPGIAARCGRIDVRQASGRTVLNCELCAGDGGELLWRDARCRVVLIDDPDYPGYCRAVWNAHVAEMTDLAPRERAHLMAVVHEVEAVLRECLRPDKINLASLGNAVPHL